MTSFVAALDTGPLHRSRFLRLAFRPIVGAGLAVVVYFLRELLVDAGVVMKGGA